MYEADLSMRLSLIKQFLFINHAFRFVLTSLNQNTDINVPHFQRPKKMSQKGKKKKFN